MKQLLKVAFVMGSYSLVSILVGLVRSKVSALVLGPEGVGLLSQANSFLIFMATVCTFSMGTGITKRLSETLGANDEGRMNELLDTSFLFFCVTGLGIPLLLFPLFFPLTRFLFGDTHLALPFLSVMMAIPLNVMISGLGNPITLGANRYDLYTRAMITGTLFGLMPFLIMTWIWGLPGAIYSVSVSTLIRAAIFFHYGARAVKWRPRLKGHFSVEVLRSLKGYSIAMLVTGVLLEGSDLVIRTSILNRINPAANGIYQVPAALSYYYSVFFTNALWGYFFPKVSQQINPKVHETELNNALRFILLGFTAMAFFLITFRVPLIIIAYSDKFIGGASLIPYYVLGDLFFLLAMVYSVSLLSLQRLKGYVMILVGYYMLRTILALFFLDRFGILGPVIAHVMSAAAMLVALAAYHTDRLSFPVAGHIIRLLIFSVAMVAISVALPLPTSVQVLLQIVLFGIWLLMVLTSEERNMLMRLLRQRDFNRSG